MLLKTHKCKLANTDFKFITKASEIKQMSSTQDFKMVIWFSNKILKEVNKTKRALLEVG